MLSSSPEKLRAMKEKMKKVLGSMRKKSTHSGVIDEDIRSTYSAVSMDEPSITSAATSMRTSRSKVGSAFVPVTKTTLPKDISISSPEVVSAKVDEEEDFNRLCGPTDAEERSSLSSPRAQEQCAQIQLLLHEFQESIE